MPHLRIKICGVTTVGDALLAADLGADALGLNFYPPSPRCLDLPTAARILGELPPFVQPVGVFVNEPLAAIAERIRALVQLRTIQWYGDNHETASRTVHGLIAAFAVRDAASLTDITTYLDLCRAQGEVPVAVLVDAHVAGQHGGTGRTAPWDLLASFRPGVPVILAGGLTPDNVAEAVRRVRPWAVDVASGVESSPGRKDADKMRRFIANAREALG
jgi:phosphoribosylanthranilate isomerase